MASGWEKRVVEKNVQDSRRRVWMDAKAQHFGSFDELNNWLEARCRALCLELQQPNCYRSDPHQTTWTSQSGDPAGR